MGLVLGLHTLVGIGWFVFWDGEDVSTRVYNLLIS